MPRLKGDFEVSDGQLYGAVCAALEDDPSGVNGLPTYADIVARCGLERSQINDRMRRLEDAGRVAIHESVAVCGDSVTNANTVEPLDGTQTQLGGGRDA